MLTSFLAPFLVFGAAAPCLAWSGHEVTEGPVRLFVEEIPPVTAPRQPTTVHVLLDNKGADEVSGELEVRNLVDGWHPVGRARKSFRAARGTTAHVEFQIASGPPVYSALYPVHVYATFQVAGTEHQLHAVRIFSVRLAHPRSSRTPAAFRVNTVPEQGALPLYLLNTHRVVWNFFDEPPVFLPPGWTGSDPTCRATMSVTHATRGDTRACINMHPPWSPRAGTIFCDYLLKLPAHGPLKLVFATAIRDNRSTEPPSDGVLFRVWVGLDRRGQDAKVLYQKFTAAKQWTPGEADLTPFAGKTILLRLESNPGPKHDTTCDSSYWAEPTVIAGTGPRPPKLLAPSAAEVRRSQRLAKDLLAGRRQPDGVNTFLLPGTDRAGGAAVVEPGKQGLLDGLLTLAGPSGVVTFRGFIVDIEDLPVGRWPAAFTCRRFQVRKPAITRKYAEFIHTLVFQGQEVALTLALRAEGPGLRVSVRCPRRVSQFAVGPWEQRATRVYYGHGYCIVDPKAFRAGFGGHNLATSHVGCDFSGGLSVLQAVDNPPNYFDVNPRNHIYALSTDQDCTLTLVPGADAFACALAYRPLFDKHPAGGVKRLAGRMCFDIWGGRYADIARHMATMIRYGLTDSFLTVHNWQRWGYDYRLPDIWPPNPRFGTLADMRRIAAVCTAHDIPWGLHDNYIDFYPDATGFSYEHIYFTRAGQPHRAWYNEGRDAQSYKWRPDHILPFIQRNLRQVKAGVHPTHYFLDVFTSSGCMDWWDPQGHYHSGNETRKYWGEAFAWIRNYLGDNAPTTSEAGDDQLIGYLDGADCQWLTLSPEPKRFCLTIRCRDWERVPWYDAVNHANFILHGVGYSGRYQGGKSREFHGINSDDYLSAEALSGHALMTDAGSWGRYAVRKYYLLQDFARHVALRHIAGVEFVGNDIHRLKVTWDNGAVAYVNRGTREWRVAGCILPRYGFHLEYTTSGLPADCTVERRDGKWRESSRGPSGWYCNARTVPSGGRLRLRIAPRIENFRDLEGGRFKWTMVWDVKQRPRSDFAVFVHFCSPKSKRADGIVFQDDHQPVPATSRWKGRVRIERTVTVPADAEGSYAVLVGLHQQGVRATLDGYRDPGGRILVGTVHVHRTGKQVTLTFTPPPPAPPSPEPRTNPPGTAIDFGFAVTEGAFRLQKVPTGLRLIPLPDSPPFTVVLRLKELLKSAAKVKSVSALALDPSVPPKRVVFQQAGDTLKLSVDGKTFAYDIRLEKQ